MPELAEVETTRRGIQDLVCKNSITQVILRHSQLRWPIPKNLSDLLIGQKINAVKRRAKYLLFDLDNGTMIIHLGMSGCLRIINADTPAQKHDHIDIVFDNGFCLRYTDPRRFGSVHWTANDPSEHRLLRHLGPEPLTTTFSASFLLEKAKNRTVSVKTLIMDATIVVGVGNIYATESLFRAKIHPLLPVNQLTINDAQRLVAAIKAILRKAIEQGGTTLRDFLKTDGKPGYFRQHLKVYGKTGEPCSRCKTPLKLLKINQRSTVYCPTCQL